MISLKPLYDEIICLACFLPLFCGCDVYQPTKCRSYVGGYVQMNAIDIWQEKGMPSYLIVHLKEEPPVKTYHMCSTGKDAEIYTRLCTKHEDMTYNKVRSIGPAIEDSTPFFVDCDFTSIEVFADKDFNEEHPAGSNLGDIVRFMSWSPIKYIKSGYSELHIYNPEELSSAFYPIMREYFMENYFQRGALSTCYPIDKLICDTDSDDLVLLGHDAPGFLGALYFEMSPDDEKEFVITVTFNTDDGKSLSATTMMKF